MAALVRVSKAQEAFPTLAATSTHPNQKEAPAIPGASSQSLAMSFGSALPIRSASALGRSATARLDPPRGYCRPAGIARRRSTARGGSYGGCRRRAGIPVRDPGNHPPATRQALSGKAWRDRAAEPCQRPVPGPSAQRIYRHAVMMAKESGRGVVLGIHPTTPSRPNSAIVATSPRLWAHPFGRVRCSKIVCWLYPPKD